MNYQKEREDFLLAMAKEGVPADVARAVLRDANTIQRLAVAACNRELAKREILADEDAQARIIARLASLDIEPVFSGDPRGACVKLRVPSGRTDDWGQVGLCVPTRRY